MTLKPSTQLHITEIINLLYLNIMLTKHNILDWKSPRGRLALWVAPGERV